MDELDNIGIGVPQNEIFRDSHRWRGELPFRESFKANYIADFFEQENLTFSQWLVWFKRWLWAISEEEAYNQERLDNLETATQNLAEAITPEPATDVLVDVVFKPFSVTPTWDAALNTTSYQTNGGVSLGANIQYSMKTADKTLPYSGLAYKAYNSAYRDTDGLMVWNDGTTGSELSATDPLGILDKTLYNTTNELNQEISQINQEITNLDGRVTVLEGGVTNIENPIKNVASTDTGTFPVTNIKNQIKNVASTDTGILVTGNVHSTTDIPVTELPYSTGDGGWVNTYGYAYYSVLNGMGNVNIMGLGNQAAMRLNVYNTICVLPPNCRPEKAIEKLIIWRPGNDPYQLGSLIIDEAGIVKVLCLDKTLPAQRGNLYNKVYDMTTFPVKQNVGG